MEIYELFFKQQAMNAFEQLCACESNGGSTSERDALLCTVVAMCSSRTTAGVRELFASLGSPLVNDAQIFGDVTK